MGEEAAEEEEEGEEEIMTEVSALFIEGCPLSFSCPGQNSDQSKVLERPSRLLTRLLRSGGGAESVMSSCDFLASTTETCEELGGGWMKFCSTFDLVRSSGRELRHEKILNQYSEYKYLNYYLCLLRKASLPLSKYLFYHKELLHMALLSI